MSDLLVVERGVRLRHGPQHMAEDLHLLEAGILDKRSFRDGYRPMVNPVELRTTSLVSDDADVDPAVIVTDEAAFTDPGRRKDGTLGDRAFGMRRRCWRQIRRQHNLQLTVGKNQIQRIQTFGDVGSGLNGAIIAYTGTTATTLTGASGLSTATSSAGNAGLQGHIVYVQNATPANSVIGVVLSNTSTAITVDQWYALPLTGAAGTTPANSAGSAFLLPGGSWAWWVALSTNSSAAAAGDVNRTADGLWGDGTGSGASTELTANQMGRAYCGQGGGTAPTIPGSAQLQFNHTWTFNGSVSPGTIQKVVLFNALAAAGCLPLLETLLNAPANVNTNGDTVQLAGWAITC